MHKICLNFDEKTSRILSRPILHNVMTNSITQDELNLPMQNSEKYLPPMPTHLTQAYMIIKNNYTEYNEIKK